MDNINWDMVKAITGIMSVVMGLIGGAIVLATKWIFITKKDHEDGIRRINARLYDQNNITIFIPRLEYEKDVAEKTQKCRDDLEKIWGELKDIVTNLVRRGEWEQSKEDRERRRDLSQISLCKKIDKLDGSINDMRKEQNATNESLSNLIGRFDTYLNQKEKENK